MIDPAQTRGNARLAPLLGAILVLAISAWLTSRPDSRVTVTAAGPTRSENHFSPSEDLERLDVAQLDRAQRTLDIAMYAFADRYLAEAVLRAAHRGVTVRIYRDREQFEEEQRHADQRHEPSATDIFHGEARIQVRVKASGRHDLMHLKAYLVDGGLLRDGSANWSNAGLKQQDNNAHFTNDPAQVRAFQADFERMWTRLDNERVQ